MAFFIQTDNGFLGSKGIFRELYLTGEDKAVLWEIIPHDQAKNEYYISDEQKLHFIKRYRKDGLTSTGNREQRAVITIEAPYGFRNGSSIKMFIEGNPICTNGASVCLGHEPENFILRDGSLAPRDNQVNVESRNENFNPKEKSLTESEPAFCQNDFPPESSSSSSPGLSGASAKPNASSVPDSCYLGKDISQKIQNNITNAQAVLEERIIFLQKEMGNLLQESEACALLAEKCKSLEASIDRLSSMTANREAYQKHLDELLAILPQENRILFNCESEAAQRLEDILTVAETHKEYMEKHLATIEKEYQKIISDIDAIENEKNKYAEQILAVRPTWNELWEWHKENEAVAQSSGGSTRIFAILDDVKSRLDECDQLLGKEIAALNRDSNPQIIRFN